MIRSILLLFLSIVLAPSAIVAGCLAPWWLAAVLAFLLALVVLVAVLGGRT